ncbi:MAG: DUF3887 domain-containing protein [Senegalia sp. (in: firmicutes)]|uniref:DUF3887 domain-containing protein n=1 Tax=Senegalia sp. (in: firmicutes) TaxID=1924098 RepID=UPI003F9A3EEB
MKNIIIVLIILSFTFLISCNNDNENKENSAKTPEQSIQDWTDPKVENILISMNKEDYDSFSKDLSDNMKNQLNKELFNEQLLPIFDLIGEYIKDTKKLLTTEALEKDNMKLIYSADYSNESKEVIITMVFNKNSKDVEGLFISSEKIQKMK